MKRTTQRQVSPFSVGIGSLVAVALSAAIPISASAQQNVTITVTSTKQQSFEGFGVAIGNPIGEFLPAGGRKGSSGSVSAQVYDRLFKVNDPNSLRLSFLRLPLNASNYKNSASSGYDFDSAVEKMGEGDIIRAARQRNSGLKVVFSTWTPPYWMKQNNADFNPNTPSSHDPDIATTNRMKSDQYGNYGSLLKSFCDNFKTKFGFYPYSLSLQNEPNVDAPYVSCVYTSNQYKSLLTPVRNAFGWGYATQLWGPELDNNDNVGYVSDAANAGLLNAVAIHSYYKDVGAIPSSARNGLKVHMTEYCVIPGSNYNNDEQWIAATAINQFCKDVNRGKAASWYWWNAIGVKDAGGDNQPVDIGTVLMTANAAYNANSVYKYVDQKGVTTQGVYDLNNNSAYPADGSEYSAPYKREFGSDIQLTSLYYAFRRLTQSVTQAAIGRWTNVSPNYYQTSGAQDSVYAAGFKRSDGKFCLVVANRSPTSTYNGTLKIDELSNAGAQAFDTYYTSSDGSGPKNDVSWTTGFNNGQAITTLYPRAVFIFVQK